MLSGPYHDLLLALLTPENLLRARAGQPVCRYAPYIQATLARSPSRLARAITCSCTPLLRPPYFTCPHPTPLVALGLRVRDAPPRCVVLAGASLEPVDTPPYPTSPDTTQKTKTRPEHGVAHDTTVVCRLRPLIHTESLLQPAHRMDVGIPRPRRGAGDRARATRLFEGREGK